MESTDNSLLLSLPRLQAGFLYSVWWLPMCSGLPLLANGSSQLSSIKTQVIRSENITMWKVDPHKPWFPADSPLCPTWLPRYMTSSPGSALFHHNTYFLSLTFCSSQTLQAPSILQLSSPSAVSGGKVPQQSSHRPKDGPGKTTSLLNWTFFVCVCLWLMTAIIMILKKLNLLLPCDSFKTISNLGEFSTIWGPPFTPELHVTKYYKSKQFQ